MANKKTIIGMAALVGVLAVTAVCNFALANTKAEETAIRRELKVDFELPLGTQYAQLVTDILLK